MIDATWLWLTGGAACVFAVTALYMWFWAARYARMARWAEQDRQRALAKRDKMVDDLTRANSTAQAWIEKYRDEYAAHEATKRRLAPFVKRDRGEGGRFAKRGAS